MSLELFSSRQLYSSLPNNFPIDISNIIYEYSVETDEEKIKRLSTVYKALDSDDIITIHPNYNINMQYDKNDHRFIIGINESLIFIDYSLCGGESIMLLCGGVSLPVPYAMYIRNDSLGPFISAAKYFNDDDTTIILVAAALYSIYLHVTYLYKFVLLS